MAKKKEDKDEETEEINWVNNWNPTKKPKIDGHYFPDSKIWDEDENLIFHHNHKFVNEEQFHFYKTWNKNRK